MSEAVDVLGPVDWIVVEFPGSKFNGQIAPVVKDLVDRGLVRVLDLLILKKDDAGTLEAYELADLDEGELGELRAYETALAMVLSEQDVADLAEAIEPGSSAAVLVWENLWAAPFGTAVRQAGVSWSLVAVSPPKRCWPRSRPRPRKEPDHAIAARRRRRTAAAVGGAVVVAHGIN